MTGRTPAELLMDRELKTVLFFLRPINKITDETERDPWSLFCIQIYQSQ